MLGLGGDQHGSGEQEGQRRGSVEDASVRVVAEEGGKRGGAGSEFVQERESRGAAAAAAAASRLCAAHVQLMAHVAAGGPAMAAAAAAAAAQAQAQARAAGGSAPAGLQAAGEGQAVGGKGEEGEAVAAAPAVARAKTASGGDASAPLVERVRQQAARLQGGEAGVADVVRGLGWAHSVPVLDLNQLAAARFADTGGRAAFVV